MMLKSIPPLFLVASLMGLSACKQREATYYEVPKEPEPAVAANESALPSGHPPVESMGSASQAMGSLPGFSAPRNQTELTWTTPEGWVEGSVSSVRIASFLLDGLDRSHFDLAVTRFPGDVGGMFSNVNRWRGQLGLAPYSTLAEAEADEERLQNEHFEFSVFRMANTANPPMATEVAILELSGFSWFFKATGVQERVDAESTRFREFLLSIQPGPSDS